MHPGGGSKFPDSGGWSFTSCTFMQLYAMQDNVPCTMSCECGVSVATHHKVACNLPIQQTFEKDVMIGRQTFYTVTRSIGEVKDGLRGSDSLRREEQKRPGLIEKANLHDELGTTVRGRGGGRGSLRTGCHSRSPVRITQSSQLTATRSQCVQCERYRTWHIGR